MRNNNLIGTGIQENLVWSDGFVIISSSLPGSIASIFCFSFPVYNLHFPLSPLQIVDVAKRRNLLGLLVVVWLIFAFCDYRPGKESSLVVVVILIVIQMIR